MATINYFDTNNSSSYNGLQLKLNQRFSNGLQFLASYTFAKSLDYAGSPASGGGAVGGPQSVTLFDESRGPSGFDVKHSFVLSYVWDLPFGKDHTLASGGFAAAAHRELAVQRHRDAFAPGRPFTVFLNTGVNNGAPSWPDRIGDGKLDKPERRPVVRHQRLRGAARRNTLRHLGPRHPLRPRRADRRRLASARRFPKGGRFNVQFRATHSTCSTPRSSASRTRTSARPPRAGSPPRSRQPPMQFALKLDW